MQVRSETIPRGVCLALLGALVAGCSSPAGDSRGVSFLTSDGFRLEGRLEGAGPDAAVMVPGSSGEGKALRRLRETLVEKGWRVLSFDLRGHGDSDGRPDAGVADRDTAAAIRYIRRRAGTGKVVVIGAAEGGTAALVAAEREEPDAVVSISAPSRSGMLDALAAVGRVRAAKLFVAGHRGERAADAEALYGRSADPRKLVLVGESNEDLAGGLKSPEAEKEILEFLAGAGPGSVSGTGSTSAWS